MLYMEDFLEMIEHLPIELRERFTEMREMDLSVQNRVDRLNERQKGFFGNCKKVKVGERDEEFQKIRAEYTKVIEDSSEKIQNAEECYNLVDRRNQNIDPGTSQPMLDVVNSGSLMDESLIDGGLSGSPSAEDLLGGAGGRDAEDWNYDPSEPRYCVCNQVSYGDMVACDNEACPYEWFHYPCVAITAPPKGKWFCPTCLARRKSGRK